MSKIAIILPNKKSNVTELRIQLVPLFLKIIFLKSKVIIMQSEGNQLDRNKYMPSMTIKRLNIANKVEASGFVLKGSFSMNFISGD